MFLYKYAKSDPTLTPYFWPLRRMHSYGSGLFCIYDLDKKYFSVNSYLELWRFAWAYSGYPLHFSNDREYPDKVYESAMATLFINSPFSKQILIDRLGIISIESVSYTHLRAHET